MAYLIREIPAPAQVTAGFLRWSDYSGSPVVPPLSGTWVPLLPDIMIAAKPSGKAAHYGLLFFEHILGFMGYLVYGRHCCRISCQDTSFAMKAAGAMGYW